jgi:hypothetical protein
MGCPFVFPISLNSPLPFKLYPIEKKLLNPLELPKHCIILSRDFWNVCAFFSAFMFSLLGWQQQRN